MELYLNTISKRYKDVIALDDVNVTFTPGIWGLLGANGAGKSTLLEIIVGNIKATTGQIYYNNGSIDLDVEYRDVIGYLPQKFSVDNHITVIDYLDYMAALKDIPTRISKKRIKDLMDLLELKQYAKKPVIKLSGGTRQRVGIAQALLNNPKILILDEPTSGLDPKERIRLRGILSKLGKEIIIILSTHIVSDVESIANHIAVISRGKIIAIDSIENLLEYIVDKVWEVIIPSDQVVEFEKKYSVINIRNLETDKTMIRFISDKNYISNAKIQKPKLEDYYLCVLLK